MEMEEKKIKLQNMRSESEKEWWDKFNLRGRRKDVEES